MTETQGLDKLGVFARPRGTNGIDNGTLNILVVSSKRHHPRSRLCSKSSNIRTRTSTNPLCADVPIEVQSTVHIPNIGIHTM
eukprot:1854037-Amphidinium_carterae.1